MHKCMNCGTEFEGKFCPECGTPWQEEKTCPQCGAKLSGSAKFCNECGYSFLGNAEPQRPTAPPASATPQPNAENAMQNETAATAVKTAKTPFFTEARKSLIFKLLGYVPAALFALFSVLLFAFYAAPVAETVLGEGMGNESLGSVYEMLDYSEIPSLQSGMIALIVFAVFSLLLGSVIVLSLFLSQLKYRSVKLFKKFSLTVTELLTYCGYVFYFIYFIVGCVAIGQINAADEGMGMFAAGACPILLIVFPILLALFSAGSIVGRFFMTKSNPALAESEREKAETWNREREERIAAVKASLVPPVPPEQVRKPSKKSIPKPTGVLKAIYKNARLKRQVAVWFALPFLAIFPSFFIAKSRVKRWNGKNDGTIAVAVLSILFALGALLVAAMLTIADYLMLVGRQERYDVFIESIFYFGIPFTALFLYWLGIFIASIVAIRRHEKLCIEFYGVKRPKKDAVPLRNFDSLNYYYRNYLETKKAYKQYKVDKFVYSYDKRRYEHGKNRKKLPRAVIWTVAHKVFVSILAAALLVAIALSIALPIALPPIIYDNKFSADNYNTFSSNSNYQQYPSRIEDVLGEPSEKSDTVWIYYTSAYKKKLESVKELEEKYRKTEDFEEAAKLEDRLKKLKEELKEIEYKSFYFVLHEEKTSYGSKTEVIEVRFNAAGQNLKKEAESVTLDTTKYDISHLWDDTVVIAPWGGKGTVEILYTDGSRAFYYLPQSAFEGITEKGEYTISWSDMWGAYSATVQIT